VILLIRVVNLMIGRLWTANDDFYDLRVLQPDRVSSGLHFLSKCEPDGSVIPLSFVNMNRMEMSSDCHLQNKMTTE